jgi:nucleotide-binding universal stress UspA family protein
MQVSSLSLQSTKNSRRVIACVDLSAHARVVAQAAASLALALDLPLTLFHVIELAGGQRPDPFEWNLRRQQARNQLARLRSGLPLESKSISIEVAEGEPVHAICDRGAAPGSIVVLGVNEPGGHLFFRGRTAQPVLESGVAPVLLVPKGLAPAGPSFARILVPLDGSHFSEAALAEATRLARKTGAELLLTHVVAEAGMMAFGLPESVDLELRLKLDRHNQSVASDFLEQATRRVAQQGLKVRCMCLKGEPRSTLQQAIADAKPSLVILSARGQGGRLGLDLAIGSTASYLLDHLVGPTMIIPAASASSDRPVVPAPEYRMTSPNHAA